MDNVCHTLVGVAVARAGLNTKTRLATVTLAVAANLPDIDVLVFASDIPSVALRRGWTHGPVALVLLPIALAGVMWVLAGRPRSASPERSFRWLLGLSLIGVLTHVFLDYLNNYGIRLLMPFSEQWYYGDAVFIVDVWLWSMLGIGALLARGGRTRPSRIGLAAASLYIIVMLVSARAARAIVVAQWTEARGAPPRALMVGPVPLNPFRKAVIVDAGDRYETGSFTWATRRAVFEAFTIPKNATLPLTAIARLQEPAFDRILIWARFPYWEIDEGPAGTTVRLKDARFPRVDSGGFSATTVVK